MVLESINMYPHESHRITQMEVNNGKCSIHGIMEHLGLPSGNEQKRSRHTQRSDDVSLPNQGHQVTKKGSSPGNQASILKMSKQNNPPGFTEEDSNERRLSASFLSLTVERCMPPRHQVIHPQWIPVVCLLALTIA